jgi:hypothetical protein
MTFHTFLGKYKRERYYLAYNGEVTLNRAVRIITSAKPLPKLETPALVLNRFQVIRKEVTNGYIETVYNRYINLERTTGWYGLDVDGCGNMLNLVRHRLFDHVPDIKVVWTSSSGQGVKAIGHSKMLEDLSPDQFRTVYKLVCAEIKCRTIIKINFDMAMSRCHQPIFLNSDPKALVR